MKFKKGFLWGDVGRIGIVFFFVNFDIFYVVIELLGSKSGFYCFFDMGESWEK